MKPYYETPDGRAKLYLGDSRYLASIADESVDMVITSPPYFNAREYSQWETYGDFLCFLMLVWNSCWRILRVGGRIAVNTCQGYGRQPYTPLGADVTKQIQAFFILRGHIIWDKGITGGCRLATSWGSWLSASNPYLRDSHEVIVVGSKGRLGRGKGESDIARDEFLRWTESVWHMGATNALRSGHPAAFPDELPLRLIKLYSFRDDIILDPFVGSGTTCAVAYKLGRRSIGIDAKEEYLEIAKKRLLQGVLLW